MLVTLQRGGCRIGDIIGMDIGRDWGIGELQTPRDPFPIWHHFELSYRITFAPTHYRAINITNTSAFRLHYPIDPH
jgi:hypothetical protein